MIGLIFDISDLTYNYVNESLNQCISYTLPTGIITSWKENYIMNTFIILNYEHLLLLPPWSTFKLPVNLYN